MGEHSTMQRLALCLCLAVFAASALADVSELPESTEVESVEPADMEFLEASFQDAKQTVTGLMQAGKKDAACKDLADASKKEVKDSVAAQQKVVKGMPNGSQYNAEGKDIVKEAEGDLKKAKQAVSDAQNKITAAKAVKINFGDFVVSSLDGKTCPTFYDSLVYKNAKKKIKDAETHYTKKVGEKNAADKALANAKKEAERLVRHCQCASKRAVDKAIADFNSKSAAMNKATWTKAYHMECVLAGKTAAGCSVPAVPKVVAVPMAAGVSTACSGKSNYIGCFHDNSSRDFKHGPKRYGHNPTKCMSACKDYKYIALQNGGRCNCDNTYSTPSSTYPKMHDNQCNKGGTGQGGGWKTPCTPTSTTSRTSSASRWARRSPRRPAAPTQPTLANARTPRSSAVVCRRPAAGANSVPSSASTPSLRSTSAIPASVTVTSRATVSTPPTTVAASRARSRASASTGRLMPAPPSSILGTS